MATALITSSGRITIPQEVRDALGVEAGDRVEFIAVSPGVYLVVAATRDVRHLKGMIAKPLNPVSIEEIARAGARRIAQVISLDSSY